MTKRLAVLIALSCLPFLHSCATASAPSVTAERAAGDVAMSVASQVEQLEADGLLAEFAVAENRAMVDRIAWQALDLNAQHDVASVLARHRQLNGYVGEIRILDRASGRTLMTYNLHRGAGETAPSRSG